MRFPVLVTCVALSGGCAPSQGRVSSDPRASLQSFYDAYTTAFERGQSHQFVLDTTTMIGADLRRALLADWDASAADSTQIVGLDFDPFLNSQDPCGVYRVGADSQAGQQHFLQVSAFCPADTALAAVAVLSPRGPDGWAVTDIRYPSDTSTLRGLLSRLDSLRAVPDSSRGR